MHVKKSMIDLLQLYIILAAIYNSYKTISDYDYRNSLYYGHLKYSNFFEIFVINSNAFSKERYFSPKFENCSIGIRQYLINDLTFNYSQQSVIISTYPLHIERQSDRSNISSTNSCDIIVPDLQIISSNENKIGLFSGDEYEDNTLPSNFKYSSRTEFINKNKVLGNSFYDLYLNTSNIDSLENFKEKNDIFLQNQQNCSAETFDFYNRHLTKLRKMQEIKMTDVLYKQDVDLGYTLSGIKSSSIASLNTKVYREEEAEKVEAIQSIKENELADILYQQDIDLGYILASTNEKDITSLTTVSDLHENCKTISDHASLKLNKTNDNEISGNSADEWAGIPFKIDNETGEYIRLHLDDLFQDILPVADNNIDNYTISTSSYLSKNNCEKKNCSDISSDDISMIMQSFWPSSQDQKTAGNVNQISNCYRPEMCGILESEAKQANSSRLHSGLQDVSRLVAPTLELNGVNPEIAPYTHFHAHYLPKNSAMLSYASRQHGFPNSSKEDTRFQVQCGHNLELVGSYSNDENHPVKNFASTSGGLVQTQGFLNSFLNEECILELDVSGNERPSACSQDSNLPITNSNISARPASVKSVDALCSNNIVERLDLSCDSAVSSLSSERVFSTSDGEWGEESDSGQDYQQETYFGPYDYSANTKNFSPRQMPIAQKKYHMFGKRYFQEHATENAIVHSTAHFLHLTNSLSECVGFESVIENSTFDYGTSETVPLAVGKNNSKFTHANVKSDRDKFSVDITHPSNQGELVRHNHTYTVLQNTIEDPHFLQNSPEDKNFSSIGHLTRDEKRARSLNVPIAVADIINLPMDEFNERISKYDLSENQLSLIRDIRRRGKNKVAAQNCRKRKLDQILCLEDEVREVRRRKEKLHSDRAFISSEKKRIANKYATLHQHIFKFLKDADGNPCSPSKYSLQQTSDGSIHLLPRESTKLDPSCQMSFLVSGSDTDSKFFFRQRRLHEVFSHTDLNETSSSIELKTFSKHKND